jgi:hypothetical protein
MFAAAVVVMLHKSYIVCAWAVSGRLMEARIAELRRYITPQRRELVDGYS